jgi:hypothetical protein
MLDPGSGLTSHIASKKANDAVYNLRSYQLWFLALGHKPTYGFPIEPMMTPLIPHKESLPRSQKPLCE